MLADDEPSKITREPPPEEMSLGGGEPAAERIADMYNQRSDIK